MPAAWIPITVFAAAAQTVRNAAQRHLTGALGTLGATLVRFLYGVPFAAAWLAAALAFHPGARLAPAHAAFAAWVLVGAVGQIGAMALLLKVMEERNFALGVAYSKSEVLQVAVFGLLFLGDPITAGTGIAVVLGTAGVFLLSGGWRAGWSARSAGLGVACGGLFAISTVGYRGAELALAGSSFVVTAAFTLLVAQAVQTLILCAWLLVRDRSVVMRALRAWRVSLVAGFMGAAASAGWFTAFAIEPVAHVRTLGLVELVFSYAVSRRLFRERLSPVELAGIVLLGLGVAAITVAR
ncbi:MAG TPA: DMT family transporter [Usitatibacter sp.]|nr:DMT family transporter [Usitatibacter sp.]